MHAHTYVTSQLKQVQYKHVLYCVNYTVSPTVFLYNSTNKILNQTIQTELGITPSSCRAERGRRATNSEL